MPHPLHPHPLHPHPTPLQLFDFDIEVRPLLEVLVGKTVEQALVEVMEEEELAALRRQQVGGAGAGLGRLRNVCCCQ